MQYGIKNVNPLTALVAKFITTLVHLDKNDDGEIDNSEKLAAAQFVLFEGLAAIQNIKVKELKSEIEDLDKDEIAELVNTFSMNHDLKDDELEEIIEDGLQLTIQVVMFFARIRKWREKRKGEGVKIVPLNRVLVADSLRRINTPMIATKTA